jgi:50S ribosomal protein L16 3-hydroxylase
LNLASQEEVESRLVVQATPGAKGAWRFKHGPFERKSLPPFKQAGWTLLVQGVDLHNEAVYALMNQFRFVPGARLDDLMISYATDGGGVGPHFDSYDVFLLQAQGKRRWRIGRQKDLSLQPNMPLKILANFEPEEEFVLEPGDMLYLPPKYAHDGIAEGECMTYSIGFRSPSSGELAQELLQRMSDQAVESAGVHLYRDPKQLAVVNAGEIPAPIIDFAKDALHRVLSEPLALQQSLGEYLTEPKANVWFEDHDSATWGGSITLNRRTRMMYDAHFIFINGESFRASGRDFALLRTLADKRTLESVDVKKLSRAAVSLVRDWYGTGWLHVSE